MIPLVLLQVLNQYHHENSSIISYLIRRCIPTKYKLFIYISDNESKVDILVWSPSPTRRYFLNIIHHILTKCKYSVPKRLPKWHLEDLNLWTPFMKCKNSQGLDINIFSILNPHYWSNWTTAKMPLVTALTAAWPLNVKFHHNSMGY